MAAATLDEAYMRAVAWLQHEQNADGSWGDGVTQPLATAEAVYALAKAGRTADPATQKGITWLRGQRLASTDYEARRIRALDAAGIDARDDATALRDLVPASPRGWGPASRAGRTAYDTALALGAITETGISIGGQSTAVLEVVGSVNRVLQFNADVGGQNYAFAVWIGDSAWPTDEAQVEAELLAGTITLPMTAEVLRAMDGVSTDPSWLAVSSAGLNSLRTILFGAGPSIDTLQIAQRLVALNVWDVDEPTLRTELLADARFDAPPGSLRFWNTDDALIHALGLLAVVTSPGFAVPSLPANGDIDGDGANNGVDHFPFDPRFTSDADRDGIPYEDDLDRDGDGVANGVDDYPDDPKEWADSDGDGLADNVDPDDDDDDVDDAVEIARGSNPRSQDTDGDGFLDGADDCPITASGGALDSDQDGVCNGDDACPNDPLEVSNLDNDGLCDGEDPDDDGDDFSDSDEIAFGTDPRSSASNPQSALLADGSGDYDRDGLTNAAEINTHETSPIRADTDSDGATDAHELGSGKNPLSAASQPKAVIAVFSNMGTPSDPVLVPPVRHTLTGGQSTPPARAEAIQVPLVEPTAVSLSGFQPQTTIGRDLDGDGLAGLAENAQRTSNVRVDTDGDRFVDGAGNQVLAADHPQLDLYNLDGTPDPYADGEADAGTDPADGDDHPGKAGDVAPLFHPDAQVNAADAALLLRIVADPTIAENGGSQNEEITLEAADADGEAPIAADDALKVLREAAESP